MSIESVYLWKHYPFMLKCVCMSKCYDVDYLYSHLETKYTLDQIMDKMIEKGVIGKRMDYIHVSYIPEFIKIATHA